MGKKNNSELTSVTIDEIRSAIAQCIVLALRCEYFLEHPNEKNEEKKDLNKMKRIVTLLKPTSAKRKNWQENIYTGLFVAKVNELYCLFSDKKITNDKLASQIDSFWKLLYQNSLTPGQMKLLCGNLSQKIRDNGGPAQAAIVNVGKLKDMVPSYMWKIYRKYQKEGHKIVGTVLGSDSTISSLSFVKEPSWRTLLEYYLKKLMGLPIDNIVYILNYIGDLNFKMKKEMVSVSRK